MNETSTPPSLRRNSVARLGSLLVRVVLGTVSAIVTARALGPAGKGTLSTLLFVTALLSYVGVLGLGDAAIVLAGQRKVTLHHAFRASLVPLGAASLIGVCGLVVAANLGDWSAITSAVVVAAVLLVASSLTYFLSTFIEALERLTVTAVASVVGATASLLVTVVLVAVLELDVLGGVLGAIAGPLAMIAILQSRLHHHQFTYRPAFDRVYLRQALPIGALMQATFILGSVADRADLLLVYSLADDAEAGTYAVALTIGQLSAYASSAIAAAMFPRLATMERGEVAGLVALATRMSFLSAASSAAILVVAMPVLVHVLFGAEYERSVGPGIVIAAAALSYGPQLTLARAAGARNHAGLYFGSFAVSASSMIALDVVLIPRYGGIGAASASLVSSLLGFAFILLAARRVRLLSIRELRPRRSDLSAIADVTMSLVTWLRTVRAREMLP